MYRIILTFLLFSVPASLNAAVIDFEDVMSGNCRFHGPTLTSQGFDFFAGSGNSLFVCNPNVLAQNATPGLIGANGPMNTTMAHGGGDVFSLVSFQAGSRTQDFNVNQPSAFQGSAQILVTGNLQGGGTVSELFVFDGLSFDTFFLPDTFVNLESVRFTPQGFSNSPEALLDNIEVVLGPVAVPEPASIAIWSALGVAGLFGARRRRKAQA